MQKHDQFTAYFSQKSWKLHFTAQNCERRKKCRQAKDLNIAAIAYTPLASIILMAYYAYSAQSKTWKKCNFGTIYLKNSKKLLIYGFWCIILQAIKKTCQITLFSAFCSLFNATRPYFHGHSAHISMMFRMSFIVNNFTISTFEHVQLKLFL